MIVIWFFNKHTQNLGSKVITNRKGASRKYSSITKTKFSRFI